jgi:hypothetical protein
MANSLLQNLRPSMATDEDILDLSFISFKASVKPLLTWAKQPTRVTSST